MKFNFLSFTCILFLAGIFSGCSDDDLETTVTATEGTPVNFTLNDLNTRTVYDENDQFQINWTDGDKVSITCRQTKPDKADYTVIKNAGNRHKGKLAPETNGLTWGAGPHDFYAIYPAEATKTDPSSINDADPEIIRFKVNRNQICTIRTDAQGKPIKTNGSFTADPDMGNAYMTAYAHYDRPVDSVKLAFKPIMTTLQIVIKGKTDPNAEKARITGVSLIRENVTSKEAKEGWFSYNLKENVIIRDTKQAAASTETTFIGLKNLGDPQKNYVELGANETLTLTAFFPPAEINSELQLKLRIHGTEHTSRSVTIGKEPIRARSKAVIKLPALETQVNGNNWITPLDGNIYVSQLSIPGSHDAGTGEGMATGIGDSFGITQVQNLSDQWDLGIRCFDLRPAIYENGGNPELWIWHGSTRTNCSWANAINILKNKLSQNPKEFALIISRHEDEPNIDKDGNLDHYKDYMTKSVTAYGNLFIEWKPDLTVDEARGHIIFLSRNDGNWTKGGYFEQWYDNKDLSDKTIAADPNNYLGNIISMGTRTVRGQFYLQDFYKNKHYDFSEFGHPKVLYQFKTDCIKQMLDWALDFHTDINKKNCWIINHVSGYGGLTSTSAYRDNAAYQNMRICEILGNRVGTTGIMMMDYSGIRINGSQEVNGDLLLQAIINNNYKYRMQRKTDLK